MDDATPTSTTSANGAGEAATILIVEDDPANCSALARLCKYHGLRAVAAGTVAGAIALVEQVRPRYLILDAMLPDGEGAEVLEFLRARRLETRVAVVTGSIEPERLGRYERGGAEVVLRKPIRPDALFEWLRETTS